jgi:hypothetical protein
MVMARISSFLVFLTLVAVEVQGQLMTQRAGTSQLLIAAAGSVAGLNGTFFRSDINIINYRDVDQKVRFLWLPQGMTGARQTPIDITIAKATGIGSEDFVASILEKSGLGSILVTAINFDGSFDPNGRLHATSRIWSNQPGLSSGTVSQTFPIISVNDINTTARLIITGQRRDDRFRTNLGLVNLDPSEQTFQVEVRADNRTEQLNVVVPPLSMQQVPLSGPQATSLQIRVSNISPAFRSSNWIAYGSSVDNITGDSWSSLGYMAP